ncbi:MAG: ribonuclease III [Prevotella sp.]|nr:ribonuclease III [Prevotella sp.]
MNIREIFDRLCLHFSDEKELRQSLRDIMGFYPHRIEHYKLALMHKSARNRNAKGKPLNNERLEFLGDAMLGAVVGDIVYRHFEGKREGFLTNTRSKLVSRDTLGRLADEMGLTRLITSSGHQNSHNSYMAGNAFEALVGAIYLDQGYNAVMRFIEHRILSQLINIDKVAYKEVNFKSKLLEWSQKNRVHLEFKSLGQTHAKDSSSMVFSFQVMLEGVEGESGQGYSKKEAQQAASESTLKRLRREPQFIDAIFAAKSSRTQMEEQPAMAVPDTEQEPNFIVSQSAESPSAAATQPDSAPDGSASDPFDLSDITAVPREKSREEIIAEAEAAAFAED